MKTTKNFTVISLVMILATAATVYAGNTADNPFKNTTVRGIHHAVNVVVSNEMQPCNTYIIEIRDGHGQLVAPAQRYDGSISKYDFYERGPANGVRIAILKRAFFGDHFVCEIEFYTLPAMVTGLFQVGKTYRYDLFPVTQLPKP